MSRKVLVPLGLLAATSDPTGHNAGDSYFNTTTEKVRVYNGTSWSNAGIQGTTGTQGTQGTQGLQGIQGIQGLLGIQGTQGVQGTTGNTGAQGATGSQGISGTNGSQGIQGIQGTQGPQGTQGLQGIQGLQGAGYYGVTSVTSQSVTIAAKSWTISGNGAFVTGGRVRAIQATNTFMEGTATIAGSVLTMTPDVISGSGTYTNWTFSVAGLQGTQGTQGVQGLQGVQGPQGTQGVQGLQGTSGTNGTNGSQGTQGISGTNGAQGATGAQGTSGTNGTNGAQGATGSQGTSGTNGAQGATGSQGVQGGFAFGLGAGVQGFLTTPSSANLLTAMTDETGTGLLVFGTAPTLTSLVTIKHSTGPSLFLFNDDLNGNLEIGRQDGVSSTPYIDFHSGATNVDYDVRILASGGTGGNAGGTLAISAASLTTSGTFAATSTISASGLAGSLLTSTTGSALGTASAGTATVPARSDHVHPTTGLVVTAGGSTIGVASGTTVPLTITNEGTGNSFVVQDSANPDSTPFVIDAGGSVGIGIAPSGTYNLEVAGSTAATTTWSSGAALIGTNATTGSAGVMRLTSASGVNYIQSGLNLTSASSAPLSFGNIFNGNEWMRLTSAGLLLINSTSSTLGGGSVASQLGLVIGAATTVGQVIKGAASQTANLQEWQDSAGNILASMDTTGLTLQSTSSTSPRGLIIRNINSSIAAAIFTAQKSRGTIASPTVVATGDIVGAFSFSGYNGTTYPTDTSLFGASVTGVSGSTISQSLYFATGTSTSGNYTPSLLIHHNGGVGIGSGFGTVLTSLTAPAATLQVNSTTAGTPTVLVKPSSTGNTATITAASLTSSATGLAGSITASLATTTITGITSTAGLSVGMKLTKVSGTGVFGGTAGTTVIKSIDSATQITIFSTAANTLGTLTSFSAAPPTNGVTYTATNTFAVGDLVSVTGITPSTLNPTYTYAEVIGASSTKFTIIATGLSGAYTSGGTASAWDSAQEFQNPSGILTTKVNALGGVTASGQIDESSLNYGVHAGVLAGTPRLLFVPQSVTDASTNWQIDVNAGTFRWFTPGVVQMSLTNAGALTATGTIAASGLAGSLLTSTTGAALGTASAGTATVPARADHVHSNAIGAATATTAAVDTNTTQVATTAYVVGQVSTTTPATNGTAAIGTSLKYARADHAHAGVQGIQGTTGTGSQGATGSQGTTGLQGLQGITGTGSQGTQGIQGVQGGTAADPTVTALLYGGL